MKRRLVLFAVACSLMIAMQSGLAQPDSESEWKTGGTVMVGQFEQDNNAENGKEPIEWIILDVQEGKALLVTRFVLENLKFNEENVELTWAGSTIRQWLNGDFFHAAFSNNERQAVIQTGIPHAADEGNPDYEAKEIEDSEDRVFLLSYGEVMRYLPEKGDRLVIGTEYARARGAKWGGVTTVGIGETDWWLRSPGRVANDASFVNVYGDCDTKNVGVPQGIRPALWIDLSAAQDFLYSKYSAAVNFAEAGLYAKAAEIFESLGDFNGSAPLALKYRYAQAKQAAEQGDYDTAISVYESMNGYEDSFILCRAARYEKAAAYQEMGDYAAAARSYEEAGQYLDSMTRMKQCFEKQKIQYDYFAEKRVKTGMDNGYTGRYDINNGDKHYGWDMGRFFISHYTRKISENDKNNDTGNPVFLKTLGDSITLWFELTQDIDALDGDSTLVVASDSNGSDQYFEVKPTNFGRGALIIRHKDYRNQWTDPVLYTDYLLAKGTSGANTKVVLLEEGDYEVALDYELQYNDFRHITNKYDNYRIFFRFSIRNGNCMVYPFDALTHAELQNTAVAEHGFYLDLVRSRYLDIDVRRSVIVQGPSGVIEDERFNRPAKDGDEYTAEGIYTISVRNRYTGESTVKTIFVGSSELLQEYIANGFSMDRLK